MRALYPNFIWKIPSVEKEIFLTFDDGPIPEITEFVLDELEKYQAKATFFCIGGNIEKHPDIFKKIINQQHSIGNHTFNHVRGWDVEKEYYLNNFEKCEEIILEQCLWSEVGNLLVKPKESNIERRMFRPPFGRIKRGQAEEVLKTHEIIMWDVLTGDYDQSISRERVLSKSLRYTEKGSIVLFHDSIKASKNIFYVLPRFLAHFSAQGYTFKSL